MTHGKTGNPTTVDDSTPLPSMSPTLDLSSHLFLKRHLDVSLGLLGVLPSRPVEEPRPTGPSKRGGRPGTLWNPSTSLLEVLSLQWNDHRGSYRR